jgi:hypothetical protein
MFAPHVDRAKDEKFALLECARAIAKKLFYERRGDRSTVTGLIGQWCDKNHVPPLVASALTAGTKELIIQHSYSLAYQEASMMMGPQTRAFIDYTEQGTRDTAMVRPSIAACAPTCVCRGRCCGLLPGGVCCIRGRISCWQYFKENCCYTGRRQRRY